MDVGRKLRKTRKAAGLSQEAVARRAGITLKAFGELERGEVQDPHYSTLSGIATALDVTVAELVEEPEASLVGAGKDEASKTGRPETPVIEQSAPADSDADEEGLAVTLAYDFDAASKRIFDENELDLVVREARAIGLKDDEITEGLRQRAAERVAEAVAT